MNIAITGATGFIGSKLVQKNLAIGNNVRILTRNTYELKNISKKVQIFNSDLFDVNNALIDFVKDIDILYHCAAEVRNESKMYQVNVIGTQNLVNLASGQIKHWVQLSSTGVYGNPSSGLISESSLLNPKNTYEWTKVKSDEIIIQAGSEKKFTYTILRPSNVFGEDMRNQSLFNLIKVIDKGLFFYIGKNGASANYIFIENVINALILCGEQHNAKGKIYILSDWKTIEEFAILIAQSLGRPNPTLRFPKSLLKFIALLSDFIPYSPLTSSRVEALTTRLRYNSELIHNELNYSHHLTMEEGLSKLVLAYLRNSKTNTQMKI